MLLFVLFLDLFLLTISLLYVGHVFIFLQCLTAFFGKWTFYILFIQCWMFLFLHRMLDFFLASNYMIYTAS